MSNIVRISHGFYHHFLHPAICPLTFFPNFPPCYVSPLFPNLWPPGFEERQRWPLKKAAAEFVWGHSHEWMSLLFAVLLHLHILPPPPPPCFTQYPPSAPHNLTPRHSCPCWGPLCTNDPANYVFKVFGSCETASGVSGGRWRGGWRGEGV